MGRGPGPTGKMMSSPIQTVKTEVEIMKLTAETEKLKAEHRKLQREAIFYPLAAGAALVASISGATVLVLKLFGLLAI